MPVQSFTTDSVTTYTVTPSAGANGTISPSTPQTVNSGATTSFTIAPSANYSITTPVGGTCGGTLVGNTYTTNAITASCTVTASFTLNPPGTFIVSGTVGAGAGGTISPASQIVNSGDTTTLTIAPDAGSYISSVTGCSGSLSGNTYTTGSISGNCTVTVKFMYGNLSANKYTCSIPLNQGSCSDVTLSWDTTNPVATSAVTSNINNTGSDSPNFSVASGNSGSAVSVAIPYKNRSGGVNHDGEGRAIYLYNNGSLIDQVTVVPSCAVGSWDSTSETCVATPIVTISADPTSGTVGTVNPSLTWSATNNPSSCVASGDWSGTKASSGTNVPQGVLSSVKLYTYTLDCTNASGTGTNSATVDVVALGTFSVDASVVGGGGTISPASQSISSGSTANITITPNAGSYTGVNLITGTCPAGSLNGNTYTTGSITGNCTVIVKFMYGSLSANNVSLINNKLTCQIDTGQNKCTNVTMTWGTTNPVATSAVTSNIDNVGGTSPNFSVATGNSDTNVPVFIPYKNNADGDGTGRGFYLYNNGNLLYTLTIVPSCGAGSWDVVSETCLAAPSLFNITPSAGTGGSISPNTVQTVISGNTKTFTITPNANYAIVTPIGGTCPSGSLVGNDYTTGAIVADCTVTVSFSANMSGTLTPSTPSCLIAENENSCEVSLSWGVLNHESNISAITAIGMIDKIYTDVYSGTDLFTVPYTGRTFFLYNNEKSLVPTSPNGAGIDATASCNPATLVWDPALSKCVLINPFIDLTASTPPETNAVLGVQKSFTSNIVNNGNTATGDIFYNVMRIAPGSFGSGSQSDYVVVEATPPTPAPLGGGGSLALATAAYTFTGNPRTQSIQFCADWPHGALGETPTSKITESNENNNCSTWQNIDITGTPLPDLKAGGITPITATINTQVTFSSTITNSGTASTVNGFSNFFQIQDPDGSTIRNLLPATSMTKLDSGESNIAQKTYTSTFTLAGIYKVRACTDKTNQDSTGAIPESNENNNCGVDFSVASPDGWTTVTVTNTPLSVVTISADPTSGPVGTNPKLTWSATNNPTSCAASGDWSGVKPTSGTDISQGALNGIKTYTYTLACTNSEGLGPQSSTTVQIGGGAGGGLHGTLSAKDVNTGNDTAFCEILLDQSDCQVKLNWSTTPSDTAPVSTITSNLPSPNSPALASGNSGQDLIVDVPYNSRTFFLKNNGIDLDLINISSRCKEGENTTWDGSKCVHTPIDGYWDTDWGACSNQGATDALGTKTKTCHPEQFGGRPPVPACPTPPQITQACFSPLAANITASRTPIYIGESTTLTWSSSFHTSCVALAPVGFDIGTSGNATGSKDVSPAATTIYTIKCGNATASVEVVVKDKGAVIEL